jgi:hypothetical protein
MQAMQAMQAIAVTKVIEITRGKVTNTRLCGSKSSPKQCATQSLENAEPEEAAQPHTTQSEPNRKENEF